MGTYDSTGLEIRDVDWGNGPTLDSVFFYSPEETFARKHGREKMDAIDVMTALLTRE